MVNFPYGWENPMQNWLTTRFLGNNLKTDRDIWKIPKATNSKSGSPIGWSRDRRSRVVTWPAFWKLGQGATQKSGVSRSPMEISEKFQKRIIANHGSPIGWSVGHVTKDAQVITWRALVETRPRCSTKNVAYPGHRWRYLKNSKSDQ